MEKARNTKAQIDEGVRIATKIDALRVTLASLEAQHKMFMTNMVVEQKQMMSGLADGIKALKAEIVELEAYRAELQKPLDAHWEFVKSKEAQVDKVLNENLIIQTKILLEHSKQTKTTEKIKDAFSRVKINERALALMLSKADQANDDAQRILENALNSKRAQESELNSRKKELDEQERANDSDFVANQNQKKLNADREEELNIRERQINDKYATLQRTINRTKS